MPHLLKIRIDGRDDGYVSMVDAGPLVGETTEWGSFGEGEDFGGAGDIRYVRDGALRVGDHVVVRERQNADEVYIAALLEVLEVRTSSTGIITPLYKVIERFDGSQPLDRLMAASSDLAGLPHFKKDAKGMMLRGLTELSHAELEVIVTAARDSVRAGMRPFVPYFEPGEEFDFEIGEATISFVADTEGYMPIEALERLRDELTDGYFQPPMALGQVPVPPRSSVLRLLEALDELLAAGESGRAAVRDHLRAQADDPDVDLYLMIRNFRPMEAVSLSRFQMCGVAFESDSALTVYPPNVDGGYLLAKGAMTGFFRSSMEIPIDDESFEGFSEDLIEAAQVWLAT